MNSPMLNDATLQQPSRLSHHFERVFKPERLTDPRNFTLPKFRNNNDTYRPLVLEIGAGKGKHACLYAKKNPDQDIIAIERTLNKFSAFKKSANELINDNSTNLKPVHADAIPYCVHALAPMSVDTCYLLYPNPEPKNPNQQWLNMPFFEFLLSRLKPNGKVILASNMEQYIENAYTQARDTWQLTTSISKVPMDSERTHFEIKYLARNEECWEIQMVKPNPYSTRFDGWVSDYLKGN